MFTDTGGIESVERARMSDLDKKTINAIHSEAFRNDQSERITLEWSKTRAPKFVDGLFKVFDDIRHDRHNSGPPLSDIWHGLFRADQAFFHQPSPF
jgi:hypothetical protein